MSANSEGNRLRCCLCFFRPLLAKTVSATLDDSHPHACTLVLTVSLLYM